MLIGRPPEAIRVGLKPTAVAKGLPVLSWELFIFTCPGIMGSLGWNKAGNTQAAHQTLTPPVRTGLGVDRPGADPHPVTEHVT